MFYGLILGFGIIIGCFGWLISNYFAEKQREAMEGPSGDDVLERLDTLIEDFEDQTSRSGPEMSIIEVDPDDPPDAVRLIETLTAAIQPATDLDITDEKPRLPEQSRLGGAVYLPKDMHWPCDKKGSRMLFLVQINLDETEALPDWPGTGILQVFVNTGEMCSPENYEHHLKFHPDFNALTVKHENLDKGRDLYEFSPFSESSTDVQSSGRRIRFADQRRMMKPSANHYAYLADYTGDVVSKDPARYGALLDEYFANKARIIWEGTLGWRRPILELTILIRNPVRPFCNWDRTLS